MGVAKLVPVPACWGGGGGPQDPKPADCGYRDGTPPRKAAGGIPEYRGGGFASEDEPAEDIPPLYAPREDGGRYCGWDC